MECFFFFFSSRRRHTRFDCDWSSDVCSSDLGGTVLDNHSTREPSGVIRAFDIRSGALLWAWDPGRPGNSTPLPPGQTYVPSSPNSWSISSVDETLGLVIVPMRSEEHTSELQSQSNLVCR